MGEVGGLVDGGQAVEAVALDVPHVAACSLVPAAVGALSRRPTHAHVGTAVRGRRCWLYAWLMGVDALVEVRVQRIDPVLLAVQEVLSRGADRPFDHSDARIIPAYSIHMGVQHECWRPSRLVLVVPHAAAQVAGGRLHEEQAINDATYTVDHRPREIKLTTGAGVWYAVSGCNLHPSTGRHMVVYLTYVRYGVGCTPLPRCGGMVNQFYKMDIWYRYIGRCNACHQLCQSVCLLAV